MSLVHLYTSIVSERYVYGILCASVAPVRYRRLLLVWAARCTTSKPQDGCAEKRESDIKSDIFRLSGLEWLCSIPH
jgi:hypothetical protein